MRAVILSPGLALLLCVSSAAQFCDPPGEFVGTTLYPIQSLGMTNNRVTIDEFAGVHAVWTFVNGFDQPRYVFYNFRNGFNDWAFEGGTSLEFESGDGFPSLGLSADSRALVAFHNAAETDVRLAVDMVRGFGIFTFYDPPESFENRGPCFWPYLAVSSIGDLHITATEFEPPPSDYRGIIYTRSEDQGVNWTYPVLVDTVIAVSSTITASSNGEVAIAYLHRTDTDQDGEYMDNVCFIKSPDGRNWIFYDPLCVTDYENEDREIRALGAIDAVMDLDGNLHIVWLTEAIDDDDNLVTELWHFCDLTWDVTMVARMIDADLTCEPGWMQLGSPTISADSSGGVEIIYVGYVDNDVSSEGDCLGDLYMVYGADRGQYWIGPFNITETHSDGCLPGQCLSEGQPSTAEVMADSVHLTYLMHKLGDYADTVYYMPVAVPYWVGADDTEDVPLAFRLHGNYPNPFNASTVIEFELLRDSEVELLIYDITGARVVSLIESYMEAGTYSVNWDAGRAASGIYYYSLMADGLTQTRKMTFLK